MAFSCATDTTDDLGVNLGEGQKTVISISLDESRTHLGERVDGATPTYAAYWSEGDQIAANGLASEPLGSEFNGKTTAKFVFNGELAKERTIVYPAPAAGVKAETAGCYPVTFKSLQPYKKGSYAEGSAPMYAYTENNNVELKHLSGVLRFAPKSTAGNVTLKALVVEVESGKIAGNFDIATDGTLTPHADATNTVTVSFGEGEELTSTATPIYVAIPAGSYGVVSVSLYTTTGSMTAHFDTDKNEVEAGYVREFGEFEYQEGSATTGTFIIYDEATLREFASRVNNKEENFDNTYPNAKVIANIELTEPWESINGYTGTFDGGNHEISGLDAPLFYITQAAAIKNLKLTKVNINHKITENTLPHKIIAPLACAITNTEAVVEHCSVEGNLTITNDNVTTFTKIGTGLDSTDRNYTCYAGIVAISLSTKKFSYIESNVKVELRGNGKFHAIRVAGCSGTHYGAFDNATNLGSIDIEANISTSSNFCAGIVCWASDATAEITNCVNGSATDTTGESGSITMHGISGKKLGTIIAIGIVCNVVNKVENCTNYGNLSVQDVYGTTEPCYLGGIAMRVQSAAATTFKNCYNYGKISATDTTINGAVKCGGIHVESWNNNATLINCHNYGDIEFSNFKGNSIIIGGVISVHSKVDLSLTDCSNTGNISFDGEATNGYICCGGIFGYVNRINASISGCTNGSGKNNGQITVKGSVTTHANIGGIIGLQGYAVTTSANKPNKNLGDIDVDVKSGSGNTYVGGVVGQLTGGNVSYARSYCTITAPNSAYVGAITGISRTSESTNKSVYCHSGGKIQRLGDAAETPLTLNNYATYVYGCADGVAEDINSLVVNEDKCGYLEKSIDDTPIYKLASGVKIATANELIAWAATASTSTDNVELTADIDLTADDIDWTPFGTDADGWKSIEGFNGIFDGGKHFIKGLDAPLFGTTQASIINLTLKDVAITTSGGAVGALACFINNTDAFVQYCTVTGTLTVDNADTPTSVNDLTCYASMIGQSISTQVFSNLKTDVTLTLKGSYLSGFRAANCIGSHADGGLKDVTALGSLTYQGTQTGTGWIGGITSRCLHGMTNCVNGDKDDTTGTKGSLTFNTTTSETLVATGIVGYFGTKLDHCANYGNITFKGSLGKILAAGLAGRALEGYPTVFDNCINKGKITIDAASSGAECACGGLLMENWKAAVTFNNCNNEGTIEITDNFTLTSDSTSDVLHVGGLVSRNETSYAMTLNNCSNKGEIKYNSPQVQYIRMGGLIGYISRATTFSNCENTATLTVGGKATTDISVGGIVGYATKSVAGAAVDKPIVNKGEIKVSATIGEDNSVGGVYIGGIAGTTKAAITNANVFCKVYAKYLTNKDTGTYISYSNVGMITGSAYNSDYSASNCKIGGWYYKDIDEIEEDNIYNYVENKLDETNYYNYIYGSGNSEANASGCTPWDGQ